MALSAQFLDELRARTLLSSLVGASVKLNKAGREFRACCPFHHEKTPSFYVNDEKAFYHCFSCGAHGDAIRWLTDHGGYDFIDAVKQLAADAGMVVPAPTAEYQARQERVASIADVLDRAAAWYRRQLVENDAAARQLADRDVGADAQAKFGLGYSPRTMSVAGCGALPVDLARAGLMIEGPDGFRDRFRQRLMIPIHDARGRLIAFGGRATSEKQESKYVNSPEGENFDKGRTLYNLHRAAPASRSARRLVIVEGYFDVIALDSIGVGEAVAPMGTALTEAQLVRAWRLHHCPILLLDGDGAGLRAALRACERAMPALGPGASLAIALLPQGEDPDSFARKYGRDSLEQVLGAAAPLSSFVFDRLMAEAA